MLIDGFILLTLMLWCLVSVSISLVKVNLIKCIICAIRLSVFIDLLYLFSNNKSLIQIYQLYKVKLISTRIYMVIFSSLYLICVITSWIMLHDVGELHPEHHLVFKLGALLRHVECSDMFRHVKRSRCVHYSLLKCWWKCLRAHKNILY